MKNKETLIKAFSDFLSEFFDEPSKTSDVYKSSLLDEELQEATWVVLSPDEYDLHNDIYSEEEVSKACEDYNTNCMRANLHHLLMVGDDVVSIVKSEILKEDSWFGDTFVKKGTWVQTWKIHNEDIWKGVKEGFYTGLSIQCLASVEELE